MDVLFLDNHLLVVDKPSGQVVQGDSTGDQDLLTEAKRYLKFRFDKPGNVFVGLVHRLDRPVSGVVLFARTSKAASRLSKQFRDRSVKKLYVALVEGRVAEPMVLRNHLRRERDRTRVVKPGVRGAREAIMACEPLLVIQDWSLVSVDLRTGRKHQIRAQLSSIGHPIRGDARYGAKTRFTDDHIALHCWKMGAYHPVKGEWMSWSADPPQYWPREARDYLSSRANYLAPEVGSF